MKELCLGLSSSGIALVISGPSGAGKSTVCRELIKLRPMHFSVSCTTRAPRAGEEPGRSYHFLQPHDFMQRIEADDFLEHALVHGNRYGTLRSEVLDQLQAGRDVLIDIDVQGQRQIRSALAATAALAPRFVFVFLAPPSYGELSRRLHQRGTEPADLIERRLANARSELAAWSEYDHLVVNDEPARAAADLAAIIRACELRTPCLNNSGGWPHG